MARSPKHLSLCEYLAESGGLRMARNGRPTDGAGDLRAMGAPWWHRGYSFRRKLCRDDSGLCPDAAALAAWEAGYFPGFTSRPDLSEFLEAVRRDMATGEVLAGFPGAVDHGEPGEACPTLALPPAPPGAILRHHAGLAAYLYEQRSTRINGRYVGAALAGLMGQPIAAPFRADVFQPGQRAPLWSVACGTAGERDTATEAYLAEVPF